MRIEKLLLIPLFAFCGTSLFAQQHSDIEFGYDNTSTPNMVIIETDILTCENIPLFQADFVALDPFNQSDLGADDPGFATNVSEGLQLNPGDQTWLKVLDASEHSQFGMGYINFFNQSTDLIELSGRLRVEDNSIGTTDLILDGGAIEVGVNPQFVDTASSIGEIHDHVVFDLLDEASTPVGAFGMMFQIETDFAPADGTMDLVSEPFWIIFNHEMDSGDFASLALPKYGVVNATVDELTPDSFSVTRGSYISGGASELAFSDNSDLSARRRTGDISSRVFLEVETTTSATSPLAIDIQVEASVFARSVVIQSIDLFDFQNSAWVEVDSRTAARFSDATVDASATGNLERFVETGTGVMRARVRFESPNPRQQFTANVDATSWTIKH